MQLAANISNELGLKPREAMRSAAVLVNDVEFGDGTRPFTDGDNLDLTNSDAFEFAVKQADRGAKPDVIKNAWAIASLNTVLDREPTDTLSGADLMMLWKNSMDATTWEKYKKESKPSGKKNEAQEAAFNKWLEKKQSLHTVQGKIDVLNGLYRNGRVTRNRDGSLTFIKYPDR